MEDGRIIYFSTDYFPAQSTLDKLQTLQNYYNETRISIMIDAKYDKYEITLRTQQLANHLRDKWKVIDGESSVVSFHSQSYSAQKPSL